MSRRTKVVYFPGPSGHKNLPYRKVRVYKEDVDYFLELGAAIEQPVNGYEFVPETEVEEIPDEVSKTPVEGDMEFVNGDKGDGVPGSIEWHNTQISAMRVKKDIVNYVSDVVGRDADEEIDRRKSLNVIRLRAKKIIKDHMG